MKVLLTGAPRKVVRTVSEALQAAGHKVTESDLTSPIF